MKPIKPQQKYRHSREKKKKTKKKKKKKKKKKLFSVTKATFSLWPYDSLGVIRGSYSSSSFINNLLTYLLNVNVYVGHNIFRINKMK